MNSSIGAWPCSFIYILALATFEKEWQNSVKQRPSTELRYVQSDSLPKMFPASVSQCEPTMISKIVTAFSTTVFTQYPGYWECLYFLAHCHGKTYISAALSNNWCSKHNVLNDHCCGQYHWSQLVWEREWHLGHLLERA